MTNDFLVQTKEIALIDERTFLSHGGEDLHFGHVECGIVTLRATGTTESIGLLARTIITHRTAAI